jgi:SAM-dependent methyltransferase
MTCRHCEDTESFFDAREARRALRRYRRKGPDTTTRKLIDAVAKEGMAGRSVLDIGGGIGTIQHELAERGASEILSVDASSAYQQVAVEEAQRRGYGARLRTFKGDFVELAAQVPDADVVTLDRVVCCYPDAPTLVGASARKARRLYGLVYPRRRLAVHFLFALQNLVQRMRRSAFRVYVHRPAAIEAAARDAGLALTFQTRTLLWEVVVFSR